MPAPESARLASRLEKEFAGRAIRMTLLLTHTHWDHIQGLPFFLPAYNQKNQIRVLGYEGARAGLAAILAGQMETQFFPISLRELSSNIAIEELKEMEFSIGKDQGALQVRQSPRHLRRLPALYQRRLDRLLPGQRALRAAEGAPRGTRPDKRRRSARVCPGRARQTDRVPRWQRVLLIIDAQYTDEEYQKHIGWGHGSLSRVVSMAIDANVRRLILFHHDPNHDDDQIDEMLQRARLLVVESGKTMEVEAAREGAEIWLTAPRVIAVCEPSGMSQLRLAKSAAAPYLFPPRLPRGVTVAREILDLFVKVRILARQPLYTR